MASDPFTIRIFVPDGNPEGVRVIDRMNWTGLGIAFPRDQWLHVRQRSEFSKAGVYILVGQTEMIFRLSTSGKATEFETASKLTSVTKNSGTGG